MRADTIEIASHGEWPAVPFSQLSAHFEGVGSAAARGRVVASDLPRGTSQVTSAAPSVKFVLDGEGVYEIEGRTRRLRAGEFMLVEGGCKVSVHFPQARTRGLCVSLGGLAQGREPGLGSPALFGGSDQPLSRLLAAYSRALIERPEAGPVVAHRIVHEVAAHTEAFLCDFRGRLDRLGSVKYTTRVETLQRLERARAFIHAHKNRTLTLDEIAMHAALSRFHMTRSFTEAYGAPPLFYHRSLRLAAAAERIELGEATPTQVSEELGYGSLSAFTRAFRQKFGMPPSEMRRAA